VEALASYIHWDDRGQAFAMWRCDRSWDAGEGMEWFGFRFNYVVETDLELAQQVLTDFEDRSRFVSVKRRADALFPPIIETIFIDARYEPMSIVEDEAVLKTLQGSYKDKSSHPCRDYNLAKSLLMRVSGQICAVRRVRLRKYCCAIALFSSRSANSAPESPTRN
jgi:ATP-dependent helicase HepA